VCRSIRRKIILVQSAKISMADSTTTAAAPVTATPSSPIAAAAQDNTATAVGAPTAEVDEGFEENDSAYGDEQYVCVVF